MVLMGGQTLHDVLNDVWRSVDGRHWSLVTDQAEWAPRYGFGVVVLPSDGTIVVAAGTSGASHGYVGYRDVWTSVDGGGSFTLATGTASFSERSGVAMVAVPGQAADGYPETIVLCGGHETSDCHFSTTRGVSWAVSGGDATFAQPWGPRSHTAMAVLPGTRTIILAGGWLSGTARGDVWRSTDGMGATWELLSTAAFPARYSPCLLAVDPLTLVVVAGHSSSGVGGVHVSLDGGQTWGVVPGTATMLRSGVIGTHACVQVVHPATDDDSHVSEERSFFLAGGTTSSSLVQRLFNGDAAVMEEHCDEQHPAVCATRVPFTHPMRAHLSAAPTNVVPPSASSILTDAAPVSTTAASPPVPYIVSSARSLNAGHGALVFNVTFSSPIVNVSSADFVVQHSDAVAVKSHALVGEGDAWTLSIHAIGKPPQCPDGFRPSTTDTADTTLWCARVLSTPASWDYQRQACAPYDLAAPVLPSQFRFLHALMLEVGTFGDVWYVVHTCRC